MYLNLKYGCFEKRSFIFDSAGSGNEFKKNRAALSRSDIRTPDEFGSDVVLACRIEVGSFFDIAGMLHRMHLGSLGGKDLEV